MACLRQLVMERGDYRLELLQVERVLGLLDLCDIEKLPSEESNRVRLPNPPRGLSELFLCLLQDKEFLSLGPCVTNRAHLVVTNLDLTRVDGEHGLHEDRV